MNILILNYEYPPLGGGGGTQTQLLAKEYAKMVFYSITRRNFSQR